MMMHDWIEGTFPRSTNGVHERMQLEIKKLVAKLAFGGSPMLPALALSPQEID